MSSLASSEYKVVLADITYYNNSTQREELLKVSNFPYEGYIPIIQNITPFSISVVGSGVSSGIGSLTLSNNNGELDSLVCDTRSTYVFNRRKLELKLMVGGVAAIKLVVATLDATLGQNDGITLRYVDPTKELDQPLLVNKVTGTELYKPYTLQHLYMYYNSNSVMAGTNPRYQDREQVCTFCLGDIFNMTPISLDFIYDGTANGKYIVAPEILGLTVEYVNVKDNGVMLVRNTSYTVSGNYLTLLVSPAGTITVDVIVKRSSTLSNDIVLDLINNTSYGIYPRTIPLVATDDLTNYKKNIGYVGSCADSIGSIVHSILASTTSILYTDIDLDEQTSQSEFKVYTNKLPDLLTPTLTLTYPDIVKGSLKISSITSPDTGSVFLGYARNWTPGLQLASMFQEFPQWREKLEKEYLDIYLVDQALIDVYKFTPSFKGLPTGTLLVKESEAQTEAQYRLALSSRRVVILELSVNPDLYNIPVGTCILLKHHRYGIDPTSGSRAIVVGKSVNLMNNTYSISLLV